MTNNRVKKIISLCAAALLGAGAFFAQSGASITLENVCALLAERPNTTGDFTQTKTISSNGRQLKSSGTFIISTQGIMWKTQKPFPSSLILTNDAMVQVAANGNKSVMSGKDNQIFANISSTLSSVFSGNVAELKKNFDCDFSVDDKAGATSAGVTYWTLRLTPKDSTIASVMHALELRGTVEGANGGAGLKNQLAALNSLEMTETSSNKILYEFLNQKYPKELSADEKQNFVID